MVWIGLPGSTRGNAPLEAPPGPGIGRLGQFPTMALINNNKVVPSPVHVKSRDLQPRLGFINHPHQHHPTAIHHHHLLTMADVEMADAAGNSPRGSVAEPSARED
jgi:hypothetical protein